MQSTPWGLYQSAIICNGQVLIFVVRFPCVQVGVLRCSAEGGKSTLEILLHLIQSWIQPIQEEFGYQYFGIGIQLLVLVSAQNFSIGKRMNHKPWCYSNLGSAIGKN